MKTLLSSVLTAGILLFITTLTFAQAPYLGSTADFVLFSTNGAVSNTGLSHLTGNVGTNNGSSTNFGNVNGGMHDGDTVSAKCAVDLLNAYNQLDTTTPTYSISHLLGNGDTLITGVYSISQAATLNLDLTLDGEGNSNAVFIFLIEGAFASNALSEIKLINGALACNVFWKVEGAVNLATGTSIKGTIIANNALIKTYSGCTVEGRLLSTTGAVTVDGVYAYTPIGCGSPILTGPTAPILASTECFTLFSSDGPVSNAGVTNVWGDVGTNVGLTTGFDSLLVNGMIHPIPDVYTAACAADLLLMYNYLNTLPMDIELLYPAQFGNNLVLTPHTYVLNGAVSFTDTLYLNALGDPDAVFVIKIYGALSTSTFSNVILMNGTQAKNVYWKVDGAVAINDSSVFNGTIVSAGAIDLKKNTLLNGRALTIVGALTTAAITAIMPPGCSNLSVTEIIKPTANDCDSGLSEVYVSVQLTNAGERNENNVKLFLSVDSAGVIIKQLDSTINIAAKSTDTFEFTEPYIVPNIQNSVDRYSVTAYILAVEKDSIQSDDTLMVNACVIYKPIDPVSSNVSVTEIIKPTANDCDSGLSEVYVSVELTNDGESNENNVKLFVSIDSAGVIIKQLDSTISIAAKSVETFVFTDPYIVPNIQNSAEKYLVTAYILAIDNDPLHLDDTLRVNACVIYKSIDTGYSNISVTEIIKPTANDCDSGLSEVYVSVELTNDGERSENNVKLFVSVDSAGVIIKQLDSNIYIATKSVETFVFTEPYIVPNIQNSTETYLVTAYILAIDNDPIQSDDTLRVNACVIYKSNNISVSENHVRDWSIGQNQPNPVMETTQIPYTIPQEGLLTFKVMNITGQVLHKEAIQSQSGSHFIEFNTQSLSNGIYYYSIIYQGVTICKKMTVQK